MHELFTMYPLTRRNVHTDYGAYAAKVKAGYREVLDKSWPQALRETIGLCWHDCPDIRPTASELVTRLTSLEAKVLLMDAYCPRKVVHAHKHNAQHSSHVSPASTQRGAEAALPKCVVM